jgi:hypothetical protein
MDGRPFLLQALRLDRTEEEPVRLTNGAWIRSRHNALESLAWRSRTVGRVLL